MIELEFTLELTDGRTVEVVVRGTVVGGLTSVEEIVDEDGEIDSRLVSDSEWADIEQGLLAAAERNQARGD